MGTGNSDPFAELPGAALGIPVTLSESALAHCRSYVETLLLWRQRLSLTSAKTAASVVLNHLLDSLHVVPFIKPGTRVADIGSGAGFPGVPLAIVCTEARFVLIESRRKKANFLREVARQTRLSNVVVMENRVEDLLDGLRASFDVVVSRAVGPVPDLLALSAVLLRRDGLVVAMKGPKGRAELAEHPEFTTVEVVEYGLPSGATHLLLVYRRR
jgi:16S rRNA (guanine527-N7)-methyltransferase